MKNKKIWTLLIMCVVVFVSHVAHARGVEDLLVDFSDYLSTRLIPAAGMVGIGVGGIMASLGSPQGLDIVKFSIIGAVIGTAGAQTISALFF